jgi:hypothetical protein
MGLQQILRRIYHSSHASLPTPTQEVFGTWTTVHLII